MRAKEIMQEAVGVNYNTARSLARDLHDYIQDLKFHLAQHGRDQHYQRLKSEAESIAQDLERLGHDYDPQGRDFMRPATVDNRPDTRLTDMSINEINTRMPLNQRPLSGKTMLRVDRMGPYYGLYDMTKKDIIGQIRNMADLDRILHRVVHTYHTEITVPRQVYDQDRDFFLEMKRVLSVLDAQGQRHFKMIVTS